MILCGRDYSFLFIPPIGLPSLLKDFQVILHENALSLFKITFYILFTPGTSVITTQETG